MNEAHLPAFAALLLGVLAGPLIWWLGRKVLRFVAWQLEYGKAWLPDLAEQDLACPGCAKNSPRTNRNAWNVANPAR